MKMYKMWLVHLKRWQPFLKARQQQLKWFFKKKEIVVELRAYQQKNKITIVDYSSKKQPAPIYFELFFFLLFLLCICFFRPTSGLDLDTLNGLSDVLQQRLVLRALVLVLVCVHVCQRTHISVKVLFIHWFLWGERNPPRNKQSEEIRRSLIFYKTLWVKFGRQADSKEGRKEGRRGSLPGRYGSATQSPWNSPFNIAVNVYVSAWGRLRDSKTCRNQERDG